MAGSIWILAAMASKYGELEHIETNSGEAASYDFHYDQVAQTHTLLKGKSSSKFPLSYL